MVGLAGRSGASEAAAHSLKSHGLFPVSGCGELFLREGAGEGGVGVELKDCAGHCVYGYVA